MRSETFPKEEKYTKPVITNTEKRDYETLGFRKAAKAGGDPSAFRVALESFYARLLNKSESTKEGQAEEKYYTDQKINELTKDMENLQSSVDTIKTGELADIEDKLANERKMLAEVRETPEKHIENIRDPFRYWLMMSLMAVLTIFLVMFYSSVIYSAFFRAFTPENSSLFNSILYTNAYSDSWKSGIMTFLMVLIAPVCFISLAAVFHYMKEGNKYVKIGMFSITLLFDGLLAYHLARKIFEAKEMNSFAKIPDYRFINALADPNFWLVISFGFVMYIVLGFIIGLFDLERSFKTRYESFVKAREKEIAELLERIKVYKSDISKLEEEIQKKKMLISKLHTPFARVWYTKSRLKRILSDFTQGWMIYIKSGKYKEITLIEIENSLNKYYLEIGLDDE